MPWLYLFIAGLFEVVWAVFLKLSEGFSKAGYSVIMVLAMITSFYFLSQAMKYLPLGSSYAIWTGIGALGAVIVGVVVFHEQITLLRAFFVLLLLAGIIGLKFTSPN
jgi:quaternary ammonium compound-resistance protein SugE